METKDKIKKLLIKQKISPELCEVLLEMMDKINSVEQDISPFKRDDGTVQMGLPFQPL